jgi:D-alanine-D-alanine ligase
MAAKAAGVNYEELCVEILRMAALELKADSAWRPE